MKAIVYYLSGSNRIFDEILTINHKNDDFLLITVYGDTILIPREHVEFIKIIASASPIRTLSR